MVNIGEIVQAKRKENDYFYGVVKAIRPTEGLQKQYQVCDLKNPNECFWVEEMSTYEALRAWAGPVDWIEEWIGSR